MSIFWGRTEKVNHRTQDLKPRRREKDWVWCDHHGESPVEERLDWLWGGDVQQSLIPEHRH